VPAGRARDGAVGRGRRHLERSQAQVETAHDGLRPSRAAAAPAALTPEALRRARRLRRQVEALTRATAALDAERRALHRYQEFFHAFETLAGHELTWPDHQAFYVVLRAGTAARLAELRVELDRALDGEVEVLDAEIGTGERAVLILASSRVAPRVSALLAASRVEELPAPPGIADPNLLRALPAIAGRLEAIARAARAIADDRRALGASDGPWLLALRTFLRDELLLVEARSRAFAAEYLFVIEGWGAPRPRWRPRRSPCAIPRCSARSRCSPRPCRCPGTERSIRRRLSPSSCPRSSG
jgi:hypothetical protein